MKYIIIAFLWIAYCAMHSYLISIGLTNSLKRLLNKYYMFYRLFYVILSILLLIPIIRYTNQTDNSIIFSYGPGLNVVRNILMVFSLLIFFWSFFIDYDSLSFFGFRQILNSNKPTDKNDAKVLKMKGLLGLTRHPMYFALIIYIWTQTFRMADLVVNSILTLYVIIGTYLEERKLVLEFGSAYIEYQKKVPMLIPFFKFKE